MVAAFNKPEPETASGLDDLLVGRELKNYRKYLVVFLFDEEVSSEALKLAEPMIIYHLTVYKVIDFVFQNKSTLVVSENKSRVVYKLKEKCSTDVVVYKQFTEAPNALAQVFHTVLVFHYQ